MEKFWKKIWKNFSRRSTKISTNVAILTTLATIEIAAAPIFFVEKFSAEFSEIKNFFAACEKFYENKNWSKSQKKKFLAKINLEFQKFNPEKKIKINWKKIGATTAATCSNFLTETRNILF